MDFDLITLPVRDIAAPAFTDGDAAILGAFPCPPTAEFRTTFNGAGADADGWIRWNRDGALDFEG